jgi:hypothetical protein
LSTHRGYCHEEQVSISDPDRRHGKYHDGDFRQLTRDDHFTFTEPIGQITRRGGKQNGYQD